MRRRLESEIQSSAFEEIALRRLTDARYKLIAAVPNGGYALTIQQARRLKREGLSPGYPDILIDYPAHGYAGLRIETKAPGGRVSPEQREWRENLLRAKYAHAFCYSASDIINLITSYFDKNSDFAAANARYGAERTASGSVVNLIRSSQLRYRTRSRK